MPSPPTVGMLASQGPGLPVATACIRMRRHRPQELDLDWSPCSSPQGARAGGDGEGSGDHGPAGPGGGGSAAPRGLQQAGEGEEHRDRAAPHQVGPAVLALLRGGSAFPQSLLPSNTLPPVFLGQALLSPSHAGKALCPYNSTCDTATQGRVL